MQLEPQWSVEDKGRVAGDMKDLIAFTWSSAFLSPSTEKASSQLTSRTYISNHREKKKKGGLTTPWRTVGHGAEEDTNQSSRASHNKIKEDTNKQVTYLRRIEYYPFFHLSCLKCDKSLVNFLLSIVLSSTF